MLHPRFWGFRGTLADPAALAGSMGSCWMYGALQKWVSGGVFMESTRFLYIRGTQYTRLNAHMLPWVVTNSSIHTPLPALHLSFLSEWRQAETARLR